MAGVSTVGMRSFGGSEGGGGGAAASRAIAAAACGAAGDRLARARRAGGSGFTLAIRFFLQYSCLGKSTNMKKFSVQHGCFTTNKGLIGDKNIWPLVRYFAM